MEFKMAIFIFVAALLGGVVSSLLGWISTTEPFVPRKFITSLIKTLTGAVVIVVGFDFAGTMGYAALGMAFLAGAGVEAGVKRLTDAIGK
jgi:hypothetical protein